MRGLLLFLLLGGAKGHPAQLIATWWEEGAHADLRLTFRPDGRATKQLRRQCIERSDQECIPFKIDGSWDADNRFIYLHLPGIEQRWKWVRTGNFLKLTDANGKVTSFVVQFPEAEGKTRPKILVGAWTERDRTLTLGADGRYVDKDEDGETHGSWRADEDRLTLEPTGGGDATTYAYRCAKGVLVLKTALGQARTFRASP